MHKCQTLGNVLAVKRYWQILLKRVTELKLDDKLYAGAILTDLSKAFNCLPHCLISKLLKLLAYGVNEKYVS